MKRSLTVVLLLIASLAQAQQYIDERLIPPAITRDAEIVPTGETNGICISNTATPTPAIVLCSTLDLTGKTLLAKLPEYTVAALPASHPLAIVTDGSTTSDCVKGGGSNRVLCAYNGGNKAYEAIGGGGGGSGDVTDVFGTGGGTGANEICVTNPGGPQPTLSLCSTVAITGKTLQLGRTDLSADITPTTLSGNVDNYNPTGLSTASTIRLAADTNGRTISGLQGGADGRILTVYNAGLYPLTLLAGSASSTATNRFAFIADLTLDPNQGVILQYDSTMSGGRWHALSGETVPSASHYCAANSGTDTYACTLSPAISSYKTGSHYWFKADTPNTSAASINFNGIANITIKKVIGGVTTDLADNDIRINQIVEVVYDGTNMQMVSQLGNSPTGISGLTTGAIPKATSASTIGDSALVEDADSINISKSVEVGDVSTNSWEIKGTGTTGHAVALFQTLRKRVIHFVIGADAGSALTDGDDQLDVFENQLAAFHITSVKCRTDSGTSTINLQRNDGSPADILSSNLVCSTAGTTSTSFTSGEDAIAVGQMIDFKMVTAATSGTPKRVAVTITALVDSE